MIEEQFSEVNSSMSESDDIQMMMRDKEINIKRKGENSDVDSVDVQQSKRNRYHRHTPHQIQEMEAFFKDCPNPSEKQRKELSRELRMEPSQVKFWFQNKRNHMKAQHEHEENIQLRKMNEKLRAENMRYKEALSNAYCPACGKPPGIEEMSFDEIQLRIQNAGLKNEINCISAMAAKHMGKPLANAAGPSSCFHGPINGRK